jgi:hypothetical protein
MATSKKTTNRIFYAKTNKGYIMKTLFDVLSANIQRVYLSLSPSGIAQCQADTDNVMLFDVDFSAENFKQYRCQKSICISLPTKHVQMHLGNVKKKDSVTFFIDERKSPSDPPRFGISIQTEGTNKNSSSRLETNYVVYCEELSYEMQTSPDKLTDGCYGDPVVIDASDYQKLKKIITKAQARVITIKMRGGSYLSFSRDSGTTSSILEFASDDYDGENDKVEYEGQFYTSVLNTLVKLPNMCNQMQLYPPTTPGYPLRIRLNAAQQSAFLGIVQVFIKDNEQINHEEAKTQEKKNVSAPKQTTRGKAKAKK